MLLKQKTSLLRVIRTFVLGFFVMAAPASIVFMSSATPVAAAANYCAKTYQTKRGSNDRAAKSQTEMRSACQNGYGDGQCQGITKGSFTSKAQLQTACNKGVAQMKKDDASSGGTSTVLQNPVAGNDCGGVKTAIIKCAQNNTGNDISDNGVWGLLLIAINIMTAGVGVLAVAGIVYGAILYTTAEDKADQVKKAIDIITNVVIGLVAFALMWAGLNFLIPGGVFS